MSDSTPEELARIVRRHAESLGAAGVGFVPKKVALTLATVATPTLPSAPVAAVVPTAAGDIPLDLLTLATAPEQLSIEQRHQELQALRQRVVGCVRCQHLATSRTQTVFGVGPLDPELCFVGEAPGADEDRQGEPFVGLAGQMLDRIIVAMGMKRAEVFICNILRCRPPGNRTPTPEEAGNCREFLERTLELVRPKFICALGACAAQNLLGSTLSIGRLRGRFYKYKDVPVLCTYHPSYLLRTPESKRLVWDDMKMLLAKMDRSVPGK